MQYLYPMYLNEVPESTVWDLVNVNVGATTSMTKIVLPGMKERKRGAIVNVSSSAELQPMPLLAVYAATKVTHLPDTQPYPPTSPYIIYPVPAKKRRMTRRASFAFRSS